jgi:aspartate/methionine/tyrosine aminotransferase
MELLLKQKVFVAPGQGFGSEEKGWFRLVFSLDLETLKEGLERIIIALRN